MYRTWSYRRQADSIAAHSSVVDLTADVQLEGRESSQNQVHGSQAYAELYRL